MWQTWDELGGELLVACKVDESNVQDELDDLEAGNPLLPPDTDASGGQEVVPVHQDVGAQVQSNWNPGNGSDTDQLSVA